MTPEKIIESVVGIYGNMGVCAFGMYSHDGVVGWSEVPGPCHYKMQVSYHARTTGADVLITSYPIYEEEPDIAFFNFMKNVLYKDYADSIHLEYEPKSKRPYIKVTNLEKWPANVLYNFAICSRTPHEHKKARQLWWIFVQEGVHPGLAFALCKCTFRGLNEQYKRMKKRRYANAPYPPPRDERGRFMRCAFEIIDVDESTPTTPLDAKVDYLMGGAGHWCYDNTLDVRSMMNGVHIRKSDPYKTHPQRCTPSNIIWGEGQDMRKWSNKSVREIVEIYQPELKEQAA